MFWLSSVLVVDCGELYGDNSILKLVGCSPKVFNFLRPF